MFKSSGYFKGVTCPYYASGLCERTYCHFRHVRPEPSYSEDLNKGSVPSESETTTQPTNNTHKQPSVFRKLESVTWYNPTPISKLSQSKQKNSQAKKSNFPSYKPTPLHILNKNNDPETSDKSAESSPKIIPLDACKSKEKPILDSKGKGKESHEQEKIIPAYEPTPLPSKERKETPEIEVKQEERQAGAVHNVEKNILKGINKGNINDNDTCSEIEAKFSDDECEQTSETKDISIRTESETKPDVISTNSADIANDSITACSNDNKEKESGAANEDVLFEGHSPKSGAPKNSNAPTVNEGGLQSLKPAIQSSVNDVKDLKSNKEDKPGIVDINADKNIADVIVIDSGPEDKSSKSKKRKHSESSKNSKKKSKHSHRKRSKDRSSERRHKSSHKKSSHKHSSRSKSSHRGKKKRKQEKRRSRSSSSDSYTSESSSSSSRSRRRHSTSSRRKKRHSKHSSSSKSRSSRSKHKRRRSLSSSSTQSSSSSSSRSRSRGSRKTKYNKDTVVQGYIKTIRENAAKKSDQSSHEKDKKTSDKNIFETFGSKADLSKVKVEKPDSNYEKNILASDKQVTKSSESNQKSTKDSIKSIKPSYSKTVSHASLFGEDSESDSSDKDLAKAQNKPLSDNKVTSTQNIAKEKRTHKQKSKIADKANSGQKRTVDHAVNASLLDQDSDSESVVLSDLDEDEQEKKNSKMKSLEPSKSDHDVSSDFDLDKSLEIPDNVLADLENEMSEEDPFDECYQIFNDAKTKTTKKIPDQKPQNVTKTVEPQPLGKVRVARENPTGFKSSLQQRIMSARPGLQPSAAQVLHKRLMSLQQRAEQRAEKRIAEAQAGTDMSVMKKQRVAHQPISSTSSNQSGDKLATPCGSVAKYNISSTSQKREAHVPSKKIKVPRPTVPPDFGSKIPTNVRQVYLNKIIDECLKIYPNETDAYDRALTEEKEVYDRSNSKKIYLNLSVNCIKKLRNEATPKSPEVSPSKNPRGMSHEAVLGGAKAMKNHYTIKRSTANYNPNKALTETELYGRLQQYILTMDEQVENGYPRPDPQRPKRAVINTEDDRLKNSISPTKGERLCKRCSERFPVDPETGQLKSRDTCVYHWGRCYKRRVQKGVFEHKWTCCSADPGATGCHVANAHVHEQNKYQDLTGYVRMLEPSQKPRDGNYGVYALDCEMVYTTVGQEIARVTVADMNGSAVLEQLILPSNPVTDYNTRFSGISAKDMENVAISLRDVQAMLMSICNSKTILIGHSLESDLIALKVLHDTVVDTSVVFPHRLGKPYKRALRTLMEEILQRIIQQDVGGHDSLEDAVSCMDLMKWKVKEDIKKEIRSQRG